MDPFNHLKEIFYAGVKRVDPYRMILDRVRLEGSLLKIRSETEQTVDLDRFSSVVLLGAGKASAKMALAMEEVLGRRLSKGLVAVKPGHGEKLSVTKMIEAGHPVPDTGSVHAAEELLKLAGAADEKTLAVVLISGGGSALLCSPYNHDRFSLTLAEKQEVTRLLLSCGADIEEMNCIRKHLQA